MDNIPKNIGRSYYIDLGYLDVRLGMYDKFTYDKDRIPLYAYAWGDHYNPTFVCHYALNHHTLYLKYRRQDDLDRFLQVADWLMDYGHEDEDSLTFPFDFEFHDLKPPWLSALTQGRVMSVLSRAWEITGKEVYLEKARKALRPMEIATSEGGLQSLFPDGGIGFEEYPFPKPNLVLNGNITAIIGVYDLAQTGEPRAQTLYDQALPALSRNLSIYDTGYWTNYDSNGSYWRGVTHAGYHAYHIMQLWALYELTGDENFKKYATKWQKYRKGVRFYTFSSTSRINKNNLRRLYWMIKKKIRPPKNAETVSSS